MDDAGGFEWQEGDAGGRQGDTLYQLDDNGNAVSPNESNPRVAKVKDHKISKIEIAPSLYRDSRVAPNAAQTKDAINGISLSVLKGDVKPSRIENNTLFQSAPSAIGRQTEIIGHNSSEMGRYEVREMDDIIASHDPEHSFARRLDYPADAQERPYHSDPGEQEKVRGNALNYQPDFVLNTDPTAGNGPPIVTRNGIVLGGNSRTMTLQMVYANNEQGAQSYRDMLAANGQLFGIDPSSVANMRRPILVRVVDGDISLEDMAVKSRLYNQTTTQKLQQKAEGVSRARLISADTLNMLAERMAEFDTLRQFMDSPKSKDFVQSLQNDGVIEKTEYSSLTDSAGKLNDSGKKLVEDALRGFVVPNYDVLEATLPSILAKIDKAIPALAKLKARGEGWELTNVLLPALRYLSQAALEEKKIDVWLGQADLLDMDADKKRPAVQALALTLGNATQKEVGARFDAFATEATRQPKGVSMLMAMPENNPAPAFIRAFLRPIVSVDGNNIADFNPASNNTHKALQWAYDHGGKSHSVDVAMNALQKDMVSEKASEQEKIEAREMMGALSEYSGEIRIQEPKLGNFFHYKKGQELFQDSLLRQKFDAIQPAIVKGDEIFNEENPFPQKMSEKKKEIINWFEKNNLYKKYHNIDKDWDISVSRRSIRDTAHHGFNEIKAKALCALPEMLENAVYLSEGKIINDVDKRHIFAAKASVSGDEYLVGIVIRETPSGKLFYDHELTEIESLASPYTALHKKANTETQEKQGFSVLEISAWQKKCSYSISASCGAGALALLSMSVRRQAGYGHGPSGCHSVAHPV